MWWRKPYEGMDGHGTSPMGRCEGSPESSEVSSLGKLSVFSKSPIGTFGKSFITVLGGIHYILLRTFLRQSSYSSISPWSAKLK